MTFLTALARVVRAYRALAGIESPLPPTPRPIPVAWTAPMGPRPTERPAWQPRAHKDSVRTSALPIGDATHRDLGHGTGSFPLGVVGESHRQAALQALAGSRLERGETVTFTAALIPEPTNPVDANAIMVRIQGGAQVGYLQRDDAVRYRPVFAELAAQQLTGVARGKLIGGLPDKPSIGALLDVTEPVVLLRALVAKAGEPF